MAKDQFANFQSKLERKTKKPSKTKTKNNTNRKKHTVTVQISQGINFLKFSQVVPVGKIKKSKREFLRQIDYTYCTGHFRFKKKPGNVDFRSISGNLML